MGRFTQRYCRHSRSNKTTKGQSVRKMFVFMSGTGSHPDWKSQDCYRNPCAVNIFHLFEAGIANAISSFKWMRNNIYEKIDIFNIELLDWLSISTKNYFIKSNDIFINIGLQSYIYSSRSTRVKFLLFPLEKNFLMKRRESWGDLNLRISGGMLSILNSWDIF